MHPYSSKTSALYKSCTFLLTYLLTYNECHVNQRNRTELETHQTIVFLLYDCSESDARLKLEIHLRQLQTQLNERNEQISQVS